MRFANPEYFYFLIIIPLLIILFIYSNYRRGKRLKEYGEKFLLKELMPDVSHYRPRVKFWLTVIAMTMVIIALARPQFGSRKESITRKGIETVIALDISNSMLATDISPSRLEKSKKIISKLLGDLKDDKVGLIVFAGDAFVQLPITNDFISAKMFLESISPSLITRQGTDIGAAIDLAMKSFTPNEGVGKAVIIITDGENHEGGAEETAKRAAEKGIMVYVLGIGSPEGAPIPNEDNSDYRKDKDGNVIVTKLNEEMCKKLAQAGSGAYMRVDNSNNAQRLLEKELDKLTKSDVTSEVYSEYNEQFEVLMWLALILLTIDILILPQKSRLTRNFKLFGK